jgi:D-amino-acid oxidase
MPERADVVVCGAGVAGLSTALTLQQRGHRVVIVARDLPAATTSAVAAAIWYPYLASPRERVRYWSSVTYARLRELASDPATGVCMQPTVELLPPGHAAPDWLDDSPCEAVRTDEGVRCTVPVCDTRRYLPWLLQRFRDGGGVLHQQKLTRLDDAFAFARAVINCTGLGARELCADDALVAVRGQVVIARGMALPHALIDDTGEQPVYAVPRGDELVLGGTAQHGDERTVADAADTVRILADCAARQPALRDVAVVSVRVGLRPFRSAVRVEREQHARGVVVHNYGHGGSGFTLSWGCASDAASMLRYA